MDPMTKLTFGKGEGKYTIVGAGSHFRDSWYTPYEITGSWNPRSVDGKVPVEFKITYGSMDWRNIELKGLFDPEENSLRGYLDMPISKLTGEFVFKRDPDLVRFYPAPSAISARKLWEFAIKSVLDRVRQQAWSSDRIIRKIQDGKRFMILTLMDSYYGIDLTVDEENELLAIFPILYEADAQFYASLISVNRSRTPTFM